MILISSWTYYKFLELLYFDMYASIYTILTTFSNCFLLKPVNLGISGFSKFLFPFNNIFFKQ